MKQLYILILLSCFSFSYTVKQSTRVVSQDQTLVLCYVAETHPTDNHRFDVLEVFENTPGSLGQWYLRMQNSGDSSRYEGCNVCVLRKNELPASISNSQIARSVQAQIIMTYPNYNNRRQE